MKPTNTWILIADGARAKIVVNTGPGHGVKPLPGMEFADANLPSRDIVSDRPGRTFDSVGGGRHAKAQPTDPRDQAKHAFVHRLAAVLDAEKKRGTFDRLVVVAPPKTLGALRGALSPGLRTMVIGELAKDLTHTPLSRLADHLGAVLAV